MEILQRIEGGIAAPKIIEPAFVTGLAETIHFLFQVLPIDGQGRFGDFHAEPAALQLIFPHDAFQEFHRVHAVKVDSGKIDGYGHDGPVVFTEETEVTGHFFNYVTIQERDQLVFFQHRDEEARREESLLRVLPAGKGFHAAELSRESPDDRLEIDFDIFLL